MAGWTTCYFTSSLAVCQLYQDDKRLIMKCCVQCLKRFRLDRCLNSGPLVQEASA